MDGVLVDACEWHRIALNKALLEICNYEISLEEHFKEFNGIPTKIKLKKLADKKIIPNDEIIFEKVEFLKQKLKIFFKENVTDNTIFLVNSINSLKSLEYHNMISVL